MPGPPSQPKLPLPFEEVLHRHEREIMRFLLRATRDRDEALDLFQETWLRAYRAYPELEPLDQPRPWLYRIATNLCLNRKRSLARRAQALASESRASEVGAGTNDGPGDGAIYLRQLFARLPNRQRQALVMRKFGGLRYSNIAAALGCSVEAARAGVYQAMRRLKAEIGR